jgi:hypothetical protein
LFEPATKLKIKIPSLRFNCYFSLFDFIVLGIAFGYPEK